MQYIYIHGACFHVHIVYSYIYKNLHDISFVIYKHLHDIVYSRSIMERSLLEESDSVCLHGVKSKLITPKRKKRKKKKKCKSITLENQH